MTVACSRVQLYRPLDIGTLTCSFSYMLSIFKLLIQKEAI
jgi:hypothetical protein